MAVASASVSIRFFWARMSASDGDGGERARLRLGRSYLLWWGVAGVGCCASWGRRATVVGGASASCGVPEVGGVVEPLMRKSAKEIVPLRRLAGVFGWGWESRKEKVWWRRQLVSLVFRATMTAGPAVVWMWPCCNALARVWWLGILVRRGMYEGSRRVCSVRPGPL